MGKETMEILVSLYLNIIIQPSMEFIHYFFKFKIYNKLGVNACREQQEVIISKTITNLKNHNSFTINRNFKNKKPGFLKLQYGLLIFLKTKQKLK